jgi:prepilin-type N-terminal cleavage/methylation domain-containing protein
MRLRRAPARRRGGFTLIELLIVIGIIAILISLLTGAVVMVLTKMDEVKARHEIQALGNALTQFQQDFKSQRAIPSRLYLDESGTYNPPANWPGFGSLTPAQQRDLIQLAADSKAYISSLWPRLGSPYDWNGNKTLDIPYVLEGEQCLVLFLGGPIGAGGPMGFSTDPTDPMNVNRAPVQGAQRKGPYYSFAVPRLGVMPVLFGTPAPQPVPLPWPVYYDSYSESYPDTKALIARTLPPDPKGLDKPYAYFGSGTRSNGYNAYLLGLGSDCGLLVTPPAILPSPYNNLPVPPPAPVAYAQSLPGAVAQFHKADSFQIICAGKDRVFGPGGYWAPSQGVSGMSSTQPTGVPGVTGAPGGDDLTNFYDSKLGTVQ